MCLLWCLFAYRMLHYSLMCTWHLWSLQWYTFVHFKCCVWCALCHMVLHTWCVRSQSEGYGSSSYWIPTSWKGRLPMEGCQGHASLVCLLTAFLCLLPQASEQQWGGDLQHPTLPLCLRAWHTKCSRTSLQMSLQPVLSHSISTLRVVVHVVCGGLHHVCSIY